MSLLFSNFSILKMGPPQKCQNVTQSVIISSLHFTFSLFFNQSPFTMTIFSSANKLMFKVDQFSVVKWLNGILNQFSFLFSILYFHKWNTEPNHWVILIYLLVKKFGLTPFIYLHEIWFNIFQFPKKFFFVQKTYPEYFFLIFQFHSFR